MANYLQRVIASGALTGMAERPPASVSPPVPIAPRAPMAPMMWEQQDSEPEPEVDLSPAARPERWPKPDERTEPRAEAVTIARDVNLTPKTSEAPGKSEKATENAPAAPLVEPVRVPQMPAAQPPAARLTDLPGVIPGPRMQAPKAWRRVSTQAPAPVQAPPTVGPQSPPTPKAQKRPLPKVDASTPAILEHTAAPVPEPAPSKPRAPQPEDTAPPPTISPARVEANAAEAAGTRSKLTLPHLTEAPQPPVSPNRSISVPQQRQADERPDEKRQPREPVRPAVAAQIQTLPQPVPPQPPRGVAAGPMTAAVLRPTSRISIGRVDVQVHNHPTVKPASPQPARPSAGRSQLSSIEAPGIDRFAMKP